MAKKLNLYNHKVKPIGTATFDKAKNGYKVVYEPTAPYADTFIPLEDFDDYKANMMLNTRSGEQTRLEDYL